MTYNKNLLIACSLFFIILFKRLIFLKLGVNFEEAKDLEVIIKITNGAVAYKDFYYPYGFLGLYFNAFIFKFFGVSDILVPRLTVSLVFAFSAFIAYWIALRFLSPLGAFIAVLLGFSGLVTREHTYGHIFAFAGAMTALWAGLSYIYDNKLRYLALAGLASGIALTSQPLPMGVLSTLTVSCLLLYEYLFRDRNRGLTSTAVFLLGLLLFPLLGIVYFYMHDALGDFILSSFPIFTGHATHPSIYFFVPSIVPEGLFSANSLYDVKSIMNRYIYNNLRWWLIVIVFIIGVCYSARNLYRDRQNNHCLSILILCGFSLVFEIKRILLPGVNPYVTMFPTFVLLIYFSIEKNIYNYAKMMAQIFVLILFLLYFAYTPVIYYTQYKKYGSPLGLSHAQDVIVMPYTHQIYKESVDFIKKNTSETDKIVVADHNSFFYLFSDRNSLLDWYAFSGTTFHPFRKVLLKPLEEQLQVEDEIIKKIEAEKPSLVIIPSSYLTQELLKQSHFLQYIEKNWNRCEEIGDYKKKTAFDDNINIAIFCSQR